MTGPANGDLARSAPRGIGALDRLRLRITAWYVATCAAILVVLGAGLFLVVAREIGGDLDETLAQATRELVAAHRTAGVVLRVPNVALYVTDSLGRATPLDTAGPLVRRVALQAVHAGTATAELPTAKEHALRLSARTFRDPAGALRVAVAAADLEDLEDRYLRLIAEFVVAAVTALLLVAFGGAFLARTFARPVEATVEHMRQFMSDAAHELRTPVAVLRTESEVALARARDSTDDAAAFARIAGDAARLAGVVDDLFTLARAESGELPVDVAPLFLDDLASDAVSAMGSVAVRAGIALRFGDFEEAPVAGSATLLGRTLCILLDNALKYTPAGGEVRVAIRSTATTVSVEVTDTGIGIPPAALARVFERFYRGDGARAASAGAGLGLPIARRIIELHGGSLVLRSTANVGTTVTLSLPRRSD
ncbi:MAG: ATP-binding region ATPase domain protein [Gemmatimonadetes bacterium]|jgi:signal transduction histidine kinase|nr:ATP-binding region ATPase domain protein [Gemmatimonadota bacterium]